MAKPALVEQAQTEQPKEAMREVKACPKDKQRLREHARIDTVIHAPPGTLKSDIENPQWWTIVSEILSRYSRVEVIGPDGDWLAEVLVLNAGKGQRFEGRVLRILDLPPISSAKNLTLPDGYDIVKDPQSGLWQAVRLKDGFKFGPASHDFETVRRELADHAIFRN